MGRRLTRELVAVVGEFVAILHSMEEDRPAVLRGFLRVLRGQTYRSAARGLRITPQGLAQAVNRHCRHHAELAELIRHRRRPGRARFAVDKVPVYDERTAEESAP